MGLLYEKTMWRCDWCDLKETTIGSTHHQPRGWTTAETGSTTVVLCPPCSSGHEDALPDLEKLVVEFWDKVRDDVTRRPRTAEGTRD